MGLGVRMIHGYTMLVGCPGNTFATFLSISTWRRLWVIGWVLDYMRAMMCWGAQGNLLPSGGMPEKTPPYGGGSGPRSPPIFEFSLSYWLQVPGRSLESPTWSRTTPNTWISHQMCCTWLNNMQLARLHYSGPQKYCTWCLICHTVTTLTFHLLCFSFTPPRCSFFLCIIPLK